jgi:hypothetical protein
VAKTVPTLTLVSVVVLALISNGAPVTVRSSARNSIAVRVVHRCPPVGTCLPLEVVKGMKVETVEIWSSLEVPIVWIDSGESAAVDLWVMLEDGADRSRHGIVLAAVNQPDVPCGVGLARIWVAHVRRYLALLSVNGVQFASLPTALSNVLLARALGRALAHEIGHYLLGTARHAPYGLMRAQFTPQEILEPQTEARYGLHRLDRDALSACGANRPAFHDPDELARITTGRPAISASLPAPTAR